MKKALFMSLPSNLLQKSLEENIYFIQHDFDQLDHLLHLVFILKSVRPIRK